MMRQIPSRMDFKWHLSPRRKRAKADKLAFIVHFSVNLLADLIEPLNSMKAFTEMPFPLRNNADFRNNAVFRLNARKLLCEIFHIIFSREINFLWKYNKKI